MRRVNPPSERVKNTAMLLCVCVCVKSTSLLLRGYPGHLVPCWVDIWIEERIKEKNNVCVCACVCVTSDIAVQSLMPLIKLLVVHTLL